MLHNIQAELRSYRQEPGQGEKQPPSSYSAATSLQDPVDLMRDERGNTRPVTKATCASGAAVPAAIGGARSVASILDSRMHSHHQDKLNLDGGGFHETRPKLPRTRRPLLKGSASASGIPVAPPPSQPRRQRAVFVTRLGPNCDAASLQAHIEQSGILSELACTRLKTRHDGYSSIHVMAAEQDIEKLFDPLPWPEGSLFKEFTGQLTRAASMKRDGAIGNDASNAADFPRTPAALSPARPLPAGPPASPPVDLGAGFESLRSLLLNAMEGISFLTDEVAALRDENARLRHDQKRDAELQAGAMAVLRSKVRGLRGALGQRRQPDTPDRQRQPTLMLPLYTASPRKVVAAALPSDGQNNASPKDDVPPSGINSAQPKASRTPALTGASETCKLIVAPPSTLRRALFITKLNPDTSCEDISSHLSPVGVEEVECRKLKTRYDSYASFHVSVAAKEFDKLSDPTLCAKARCIVGHYKRSARAYGGLIEIHKDMHINTLEVVQDVPTRWNSEHAMMDRLVKLRAPISAERSERDSVDNLSTKEWELMAAVQPFQQANGRVVC
ncbi:hypothetical protein HPB47_019203 [Ixodes persulcatus]|uniref:Uncharacterized protein n=1 Tax=Ixodes persulcatus TaxID=34615 RepID=A0AC60QLD4_IXOPE|nr:hypothetical protein HPB47_019203 [Ixodes persulcatus]